MHTRMYMLITHRERTGAQFTQTVGSTGWIPFPIFLYQALVKNGLLK